MFTHTRATQLTCHLSNPRFLHHFKSSWAKRAAQVYMTEQPLY